MAKVIVICGKICSGKTHYSNNIKNRENAIILSCDEVTTSVFDNDLGHRHDEFTNRIKVYLLKKSIDIINADHNVILDWGFWTKAERVHIKDFYKSRGIECEMHYLNVTNTVWDKNIKDRNQKILDGVDKENYYIDEGLLNKLLSKWEEPTRDEIDVWIDLVR